MKTQLTILMAIIALIISGCEKEDSKTEHTFGVDVYYKTSETGAKHKAVPVIAYLFADNGKTLDTDKSWGSVDFNKQITFTDGSKETYLYTSATLNESQEIKFTNIPNGKYILWVVNTTDTWLVSYASSKQITLDKKFNTTKFEKVFLKKGFKYGYSEWDEVW